MVAEKRGRGELIQIYANTRGWRMRGMQVDKDGRMEGGWWQAVWDVAVRR